MILRVRGDFLGAGRAVADILQAGPVLADDTTNATPDPTPTPTATIDATNSDGVYVSAYTVTDTAGNEISTIEVGDRINIVLKVVDHASARYCVKPEEISTRINSAVFTYTGIGEIGLRCIVCQHRRAQSRRQYKSGKQGE